MKMISLVAGTLLLAAGIAPLTASADDTFYACVKPNGSIVRMRANRVPTCAWNQKAVTWEGARQSAPQLVVVDANDQLVGDAYNIWRTGADILFESDGITFSLVLFNAERFSSGRLHFSERDCVGFAMIGTGPYHPPLFANGQIDEFGQVYVSDISAPPEDTETASYKEDGVCSNVSIPGPYYPAIPVSLDLSVFEPPFRVIRIP